MGAKRRREGEGEWGVRGEGRVRESGGKRRREGEGEWGLR